MKLRTKICLVAVLLMLVISQGFSAVILLMVTKERLEAAFDYEASIMWADIGKLRQRIGNYHPDGASERMQDRIMKNCSSADLGMGYAVYRDGVEIYNFTPYDFADPQGSESTARKVGAETDRYREVEVGGKKVLVQVRSFAAQNLKAEYLIWHYKDVTNIYGQAKSTFLEGLMIALLLAGVGTAVLAWMIRNLLAPLYLLREAANQMAGGHYKVRCPVVRRDEIGEISRSFNHMAGKVESHVQVLTETSERQRRLLGNLAHELKTPMTAVIGYSDALLRINLASVQREKALRYIGDECRRLSRLSAKLLELTGIEEEGEKISLAEGWVKNLTDKVRDAVSAKVKEKNLRLIVNTEHETFPHRMDADLMISLLQNLIENACKASVEGGIIRMTANDKSVIVEDQGIGIPASEIPKITASFYMVDKSRARASGGAGLGLSLCKAIAEVHGGELKIESVYGSGTRVTFSWA